MSGRNWFRDAVERVLREDDPDIDAATLAQTLDRIAPRVVYARVRDRRDGSARTITADSGSVPPTPEAVRELMRRLPGGANRGGRPSARDDRLAEYRTAILALAGKGYRPGAITAGLVLTLIHRTGGEAQLRKDVAAPDIGGWRNFRAEVLRRR